MQRVNLVDEIHKATRELSALRKQFNDDKMDIEKAKQVIGFFNTTTRVINIAINAEKWYKIKNRTPKK